MKVCPFCDTENEDNASRCIACGTELPVVEATNDENGVYGVVLESVDGKNPLRLKVVNKLLKCGLVVVKSKSGALIVEVGLDKASADALVDKLCAVGITVKAVTIDELPITSEELPQIEAGIAKMKAFSVKTSKPLNFWVILVGVVVLNIVGVIIAIVLNR